LLNGFDPHGWSEKDAITFMDALSDYLTRRPTPNAKAADEPVIPHTVESDPVARLNRKLKKLL